MHVNFNLLQISLGPWPPFRAPPQSRTWETPTFQIPRFTNLISPRGQNRNIENNTLSVLCIDVSSSSGFSAPLPRVSRAWLPVLHKDTVLCMDVDVDILEGFNIPLKCNSTLGLRAVL